MMQSRGELPHWVDVGLIPLINLTVALAVSGLIVIIIGENPVEAMWIMLKGAVGSLKGWGYLLYYATTFVFTGLAVAVAFHAGLFNIGGEGQAYMAGVGAATVGLGLEFLQALAEVREFGFLLGDFHLVDLAGLLAIVELVSKSLQLV